jgi:hypothetical protein
LFPLSFCSVAMKFCVALACTLGVAGETLTVIDGGAPRIVTCDVNDLDGSATDVALMSTLVGVGAVLGAEYLTVVFVMLERLPHTVPVHAALAKLQVTPRFCESFCTVAVRVKTAPVPTDTDPGSTLTEIACDAAVTVTCADPDLLVSACDTAVTVTVAGPGTLPGAVYRPVPEIVPCVASPPVAPFTCHVTAVFAEFATVAMNGCVCPACTEADAGATDTVIA